MSRDIARISLEMLHKLEDFEEAVLSVAPESSRVARNKEVEIKNLRGCIAALKHSIRMYRGSGQQAKVG